MAAPLLARPLRRSLDQIRYVSPVRPGTARGVVAEVYAQVERDFGMLAPPVALHSPAPGPLAACWVMLRETLLAPGLAGRAAKETVAAAVSHANACPYCVAVHGAALGGLAGGRGAATTGPGLTASRPDPGLREVAAWALSDRRNPAEPPFPAGQLPELGGVAVTFHYLNRMVNVFLGDSPLPQGTPGLAGRGLMRLLARIMLAADRPVPGASLGLLPAAPLPPDLDWAASTPHVAGAFSRATAAIEAAAEHVVAGPVRELVVGELARWDGTPPAPGRAWVQEASGRLPSALRPAARLALLTAMSSYQVIPSDIAELRPGHDEVLIALTSWASLAAARTAASWLGPRPSFLTGA